MGCHGNHAFSHSPNRFIFGENCFSHSGYSRECIFLHIKYRNVLFTFPESEENLLLLYCYIKQQNEILNVRIKRLDFGFMILSDCLT